MCSNVRLARRAAADARKRLREAEAQAEAAAAQRRPHAADEKLTALKLRERITQIYKHKNAEKLADVPKLMSKYRGKEDALYAAMLKKYQVDERSFFQHMDLDGDEGGDDEEDGPHARVCEVLS